MVKRRTRRRVRGLEHRYAKPVERVIRFLFSVVSVFFSFRLQEGAALFYFRLCILLCHTRRAHKTTEKSSKNNNNTKWREETRSYSAIFRTWVKVAIWIASRSLKRRSAATTTNACQSDEIYRLWAVYEVFFFRGFHEFVDLLAQVITQTFVCSAAFSVAAETQNSCAVFLLWRNCKTVKPP